MPKVASIPHITLFRNLNWDEWSLLTICLAASVFIHTDSIMKNCLRFEE